MEQSLYQFWPMLLWAHVTQYFSSFFSVYAYFGMADKNNGN